MSDSESIARDIDVLCESVQFELDEKSYTCKVYDDIDVITDSWSSLISEDQIFMDPRYLKILQETPPDSMSFMHALVYSSERLIGCIHFQVTNFNAFRSLNLDNSNARKKNSWGQGVLSTSKEYVARSLELRAIIMGNLLTTGQNAFKFIPEIDLIKQIHIADQCLVHVRERWIAKGEKVGMSFIKDFPDDYFGEKYLEKPRCQEFYRLDAQPNMVMNDVDRWVSFEEYLAAFKSKYRVGIKKALSKGSDLTKRLLTADELETHRLTLHQLYQNISQTASFNLFTLNENYLTKIGQEYSDVVRIYGYFQGEKMIAFYSIFESAHEIDAHFLGYDMDLNHEKKLYMNMLLEIIREAIELKKKKIVFSRTAMEIKSSVGAIAEDMSCYIQHRKKMQNVLYARFFEWLKTDNSWIERNPFKDVDN